MHLDDGFKLTYFIDEVIISVIEHGPNVSSRLGTSRARAPSVVELIVDRTKNPDSTPGNRPTGDNYNLRLVAEGGAMRGVRGAGMFLGLMCMGIPARVFDGLHVASGGVPGAGYYIANQPEGAEIYSQHLQKQKFIVFTRPLHGGRIVDLDALTDNIMDTVVPLDWDAVLATNLLHIYVTNALTGTTEELNKFSSKHDLKTAIHDSCALPLLAGGLPKREEAERFMVDGGVSTGGLPLTEALNHKPTHVLCIQTRKDGEKMPGQSRAATKAADYIRKKGFPEFADALAQGQQRYAATYNTIYEAEQHPPLDPTADNPFITGLRVGADSVNVHWLTRNRRELIAAGLDGFKRVIGEFAPHLDDLPIQNRIVFDRRVRGKQRQQLQFA